jgi:hypothetical protein
MINVFDKTLVRDGEIRVFQIRQESPEGWASVEQINHQASQQRHHSDWHQVERTMARFARDIADLRGKGWLDSSAVAQMERWQPTMRE